MESPTFTITTPFGNHAVVLRQWITGRQREVIEEPRMNSMSMTPKTMGKHTSVEMGKVDMVSMITEPQHREIEAFVVSVDGLTDKVLDLVLDMHEEDTKFIMDEIAKRGPKKKLGEEIAPSSV